jgi:hypothetical protein
MYTTRITLLEKGEPSKAIELLSPWAMAPNISQSIVLSNDDLLDNILLLIDSPTTLLRAASVSKRWYHDASSPSFLGRYRARNPPRLLGVYISGAGVPCPMFIQVPVPQPLEHTAATHRANFKFGDSAEFTSTVLDSRDGRILFSFVDDFYLTRATVVRAPLKYPGQDLTVLPPPPVIFPQWAHDVAMLLPDHTDDATCYRLHIVQQDQVVAAKVSVLRSNEWSVCCSVADRLAKSPAKILVESTALLVGNKIYMMTVAGYILGLDLSIDKFFVIELPEGVMFEYEGNLVQCRGDDSALYLFHVKGDELNVWLHANTGTWVLQDTISVKETCIDFIKNDPELLIDGDDMPMEMGPEPLADGGDAPMEEDPEPPIDGGDALMEQVVPEPPVDGGDAPMEEMGPEPPADGGDGPDEVAPEPPANGGGTPIDVVGVGDNAKFVFLELGNSGIIIYLHIESKKVQKVYQRGPDDDNTIRVHPFTMVWPPTFPKLRGDDDEPRHE